MWLSKRNAAVFYIKKSFKINKNNPKLIKIDEILAVKETTITWNA